MTHTVAGLLAGYRDDRLDPVAVARETGADAGAAAEAARRWRSGAARALEGVPVVATDDAARAFAAEHGALIVTGQSAPLGLGGAPADVAGVARHGGVALLAPGMPAMAAAGPADLVAVLGALGHAPHKAAARVGRIAALRARIDAERRADDLAASLLGGLGLSVQMLAVDGANRIAAAAADADVLLAPLATATIDEAARARLASLALPGAWEGAGRVGLLLVGADAAALAALGQRLHGAMGG